MKRYNFPCPICGEISFLENGTNEICFNCGWINDSIQNNNCGSHDGENKLSFDEYRKQWLENRKFNRFMIW